MSSWHNYLVMQIAFDLISDIHSIDDFDWTGQPTSLNCVVAGNVSEDRLVLLDRLEHLTTQYKSVFYVDGHVDHRFHLGHLGESYAELLDEVKSIPGVTFLHNNVAISEHVAFLGCNGWWTYDFNSNIDQDQVEMWMQKEFTCNQQDMANVYAMAYSDARYLASSVTKLQEMSEVKKIVMITNTVPAPYLVHDTLTHESMRSGILGNSLITQCVAADHRNLIDTWCFGHYQEAVDEMMNGIRFVSNPGTQSPYNPKKIFIDRN